VKAKLVVCGILEVLTSPPLAPDKFNESLASSALSPMEPSDISSKDLKAPNTKYYPLVRKHKGERILQSQMQMEQLLEKEDSL
jgi:hypothetical protein